MFRKQIEKPKWQIQRILKSLALYIAIVLHWTVILEFLQLVKIYSDFSSTLYAALHKKQNVDL